MIAHLQGVLAVKMMEHVVVDVHGVGYQVSIPLSTYYSLPNLQEPVRLLTTLHVREDAMRLYGFATEDERALFELLVGVSSIGPRLALNMLSSIPAVELQQSISHADVARLQTIPGIGRKTAERVVLELQEKVGLVQVAASAPVSSRPRHGRICICISRRRRRPTVDGQGGGPASRSPASQSGSSSRLTRPTARRSTGGRRTRAPSPPSRLQSGLRT
jgi:Holliday junction DNA helicase RuvA